MTDAEIVKALECCAKATTLGDCENLGCPALKKEGCYYACYGEDDAFDNVLMKDALSLINRQKAEIKKLRYNLEAVLDERADHSEAIKEFADKVCDEITDAIINNGKVINERIEKHNVNRLEDSFCCMCDGKIRALGGIEYFIKNLLKEMVGDNQ